MFILFDLQADGCFNVHPPACRLIDRFVGS